MLAQGLQGGFVLVSVCKGPTEGYIAGDVSMLCCALSKICLLFWRMAGKEQGWAGRPVWQLFLPSRRAVTVMGKWEVTTEAAGLEQDLGMDCILKARNGEREGGKDQDDP